MRSQPQGLILALIFLASATPTLAQQSGAAAPTQVIRAEDYALTCRQIADEAADLSQRMGGAPRGGLLSSLGGVARAGAAMLIPGAGLAIAGADVVTQGGRNEAQAARTADENRWYYLNGLSMGRGCQGGQSRPATPRRPSR